MEGVTGSSPVPSTIYMSQLMSRKFNWIRSIGFWASLVGLVAHSGLPLTHEWAVARSESSLPGHSQWENGGGDAHPSPRLLVGHHHHDSSHCPVERARSSNGFFVPPGGWFDRNLPQNLFSIPQDLQPLSMGPRFFLGNPTRAPPSN